MYTAQKQRRFARYLFAVLAIQYERLLFIGKIYICYGIDWEG